MKLTYQLLLLITLLFGSFSFGQVVEPLTIGGGVKIDYKNPKTYEIGPIRVEGADNYDHNAIKLIAGLRQDLSFLVLNLSV